MNNKNWTKGSWISQPNEWDSERIEITSESRVLNSIGEIAKVETGFRGKVEDEQQANIKLIVCAPEMYEMLESLIGNNPQKAVIGAKTREDIEILLAKARGESNDRTKK